MDTAIDSYFKEKSKNGTETSNGGVPQFFEFPEPFLTGSSGDIFINLFPVSGSDLSEITLVVVTLLGFTVTRANIVPGDIQFRYIALNFFEG